MLFVTLLSISFNWTVLAKRVDETKGKREAPISYTSAGHPAQNYQSSQLYEPSQSYQAVGNHGDASAINIGAGYSIGGAKPSYSFGGHASDVSLQASSGGLPSSGHATIQLPPITLQPNHGGYVSNDISQIMSQLSQSINSGALSLQPSNNVAEFHTGGEGAQGTQEIAIPQYTYSKMPQYNLAGSVASSPSYVSDGKSLSSYGSTGPVLFNPADGHANAQIAYAAATGEHAQQQPEAASYSFGGSGNALAGYSLGGSGNSFGESLKGFGASQIAPNKASFTPSVFLGASIPSDSTHGLSGVSGSYNAPSFGGFGAGYRGLSLSSAGHAPNYGGSFGSYGGAPGKLIAPSFGSYKSEGFGGSLGSLGALSSGGHFASPPGTTYGFPSSSYNSLTPSSATHSASATRPYYVSSPKHSSSGANSAYRSSSPSHSGSKYSFGGHSSSRYSPKDTHGAHSETSYNTIKYSEELKPHIH